MWAGLIAGQAGVGGVWVWAGLTPGRRVWAGLTTRLAGVGETAPQAGVVIRRPGAPWVQGGFWNCGSLECEGLGNLGISGSRLREVDFLQWAVGPVEDLAQGSKTVRSVGKEDESGVEEGTSGQEAARTDTRPRAGMGISGVNSGGLQKRCPPRQGHRWTVDKDSSCGVGGL